MFLTFGLPVHRKSIFGRTGDWLLHFASQLRVCKRLVFEIFFNIQQYNIGFKFTNFTFLCRHEKMINGIRISDLTSVTEIQIHRAVTSIDHSDNSP